MADPKATAPAHPPLSCATEALSARRDSSSDGKPAQYEHGTVTQGEAVWNRDTSSYHTTVRASLKPSHAQQVSPKNTNCTITKPLTVTLTCDRNYRNPVAATISDGTHTLQSQTVHHDGGAITEKSAITKNGKEVASLSNPEGILGSLAHLIPGNNPALGYGRALKEMGITCSTTTPLTPDAIQSFATQALGSPKQASITK